jgi:hypothetical protein
MDRKNKTAFVLILLYLVFLAGGPLTAIPSLKIKIPNVDKVIHVLLYIPLVFLLSLLKIFSCFFKFFSSLRIRLAIWSYPGTVAAFCPRPGPFLG